MPKHDYTCPDVIYLRNRAKRNNKITMIATAASIAGLWIVGTIAERKDRKLNVEFTPEDLES